MVAYRTVVATLNAQVHQEAWTQGGDAPGCVDQGSVSDSAHRIATETDHTPVAEIVIGANHRDVGQLLTLLDTPPAMRRLRGRLPQKPHASSADRSDNSDPRRQHLRVRSINPVMTPGAALNTAAVWAAARLEKYGPRGTRAGNLPRKAGISRTAATEIDSAAKETL